jgi:predicted ribonuclease YlaK
MRRWARLPIGRSPASGARPLKGWSRAGHMTLQRGERSRLADHAAEML